MKISLVVIAYNEERNIARTLHAILAQKDLNDFEVVVVNDGSKDGTLKVVQELADHHKQIKIVDLQPNRGRGAARAAGVAAAKGDYLAFVDADITLPADWLCRSLPYMKSHDACGGVAVPDGDVAFVHGLLNLQPKVAPHTTTVSGSNGLFRREVFNKVSFNPKKTNGEDIDLGYQIAAAKLKTVAVPGLIVDHHETKSYSESLKWLYVSGRGASRQFYEHKEIRLPDLAFLGFASLLLVYLLTVCMLPVYWWLGFIIVFGYVSASSLMHLNGKFYLFKTPLRSLAALLVNNSLLLAYYLGRIYGMITEWKTK